MSLAAAAAMRDLAQCLRDEAKRMPPDQGSAVLSAMARAHDRTADLIEQRVRAANTGRPLDAKPKRRGGR